MLGEIGNDDVLLAAVTIASFALFLPASRDGGAVYFGSKQGRIAFGATLCLLVATAVASAFHTLTSFVLLVISLMSGLGLGAWTLASKDETEAGTEEAIQALRGRPKGKPAPDEEACQTITQTGLRCKNRASANGCCGIHQNPPL